MDWVQVLLLPGVRERRVGRWESRRSTSLTQVVPDHVVSNFTLRWHHTPTSAAPVSRQPRTRSSAVWCHRQRSVDQSGLDGPSQEAAAGELAGARSGGLPLVEVGLGQRPERCVAGGEPVQQLDDDELPLESWRPSQWWVGLLITCPG